jgi:hypothetical protein
MPVHFRNYTAAVRRVIGGGLNLGLTPHQVLIGNTSGGIGQVTGTGTAGQVLASNGPGADPTFQAPSGGPADKDVWLSGLALPTGLGYTVAAETFPRILASQAISLTSGSPRFTAICLPAGLTLSRMTMVTGNLAESGGTHGWYALLDVTGKVVAVTADQAGATTWSPINSPVTLPFTAAYTTTYRGVYIAMACTTATSNPNLAGIGPSTGTAALAPVLGGLGPAGLNTPPALGTVISPLSAGAVGLYAAAG